MHYILEFCIVLAFLVDISSLKSRLPPVQLRNHYQTTAQK